MKTIITKTTIQAMVIFPRAKQTKNKGIGKIKIISRIAKEARMLIENKAIAISKLIIQFLLNKSQAFLMDSMNLCFLMTEKLIAYLAIIEREIATGIKIIKRMM